MFHAVRKVSLFCKMKLKSRKSFLHLDETYRKNPIYRKEKVKAKKSVKNRKKFKKSVDIPRKVW